MTALETKALSSDTWPDFADLAGRNNGVWGGCWCTWFHPRDADRVPSVDGNRDLKQRLVDEGRAHASLVFDGETAVAWCQFGSPEELPRIYHRKQVEFDGYEPPDYRITCFFIDKGYRRKGVARLALGGALRLIAERGGGVIEAYPHDISGKKVSASFLYNGTRTMFEAAGFTYIGPKGKNNCIMRAAVRSAR